MPTSMQLFQILGFFPLSFQLTALMYTGVCFLCGKEFFYVAKPGFPGPRSAGEARSGAEGLLPNPRTDTPERGFPQQ